MNFKRKIMHFDLMLFADYSGVKDLYSQRRHIAMARHDIRLNQTRVISNISRIQLRELLQNTLFEATQKNQIILLGLDHNYAFPDGFVQVISPGNDTAFRATVADIASATGIWSAFTDDPHQWASRVNDLIRRQFNIPAGPFWGPSFIAKRKPDINYDLLPFSEKRLVEKIHPRMKSVFQLGGIGSVGLQSLYGIGHLARLIAFCSENNIPLHLWPFDGWEIPENHHVMIEIYPGFYNPYQKSDVNDAVETVNWFQQQVRSGTLAKAFEPNLPDSLTETVQREGWVPGVKFGIRD